MTSLVSCAVTLPAPGSPRVAGFRSPHRTELPRTTLGYQVFWEQMMNHKELWQTPPLTTAATFSYTLEDVTPHCPYPTVINDLMQFLTVLITLLLLPGVARLHVRTGRIQVSLLEQ